MSISCVKIFKINQHNFFSCWLFCLVFREKNVCYQHSWKSSSIFICHPNFHPLISFIHEHMVKYSSMSPNIMSHVLNNIFQIYRWHQQNIPKRICSCSRSLNNIFTIVPKLINPKLFGRVRVFNFTWIQSG